VGCTTSSIRFGGANYKEDEMIKKRNLSPDLVNWIQAQTGLGPGVGDIFFLAPTASSTSQFRTWLLNQGVDGSHLFTSLPNAYAALTANRNDVLVVLPGSYTLTASFTWGKDYTHMIGATTPIPVNQRARFSSTTAALSPLITFSADGSIMKNIMWSQDGSHASTAAINCAMTGDRNYLESVTFRNLGALSVVANAMRNMEVTSSNGENYFKNCTFGADSLDYGTATNYVVEYSGTDTARDTYDNCNFLSGGSANASFLLFGNSSTTAWTKFKECCFINNILGSMDAMTQAFSIGAANGYVLLMDCLVHGASAYETSDSGLLFGRHAYAAATTDVAVQLTY